MPKFPTRQADIVALTRQMVAGYRAHGADFPSNTWWWLVIKRGAYTVARKAQTEAQSGLRLATEAKAAKFSQLKELMKSYLKKSEVDVAGNPGKLAQIGWGPKAKAQPSEVPCQPANLRSFAQGKGMLSLQWDRPVGDSSGLVRNYIIESRQQSQGDGQFGQWIIVGSSLNNQINLSNQPQGIQLEYRIKAINTGGESAPSNTAALVL